MIALCEEHHCMNEMEPGTNIQLVSVSCSVSIKMVPAMLAERLIK